VSGLKLAAACSSALLLVGCTEAQAPAPAATKRAEPAAAPAPTAAATGTVALPTGFPERPFARVEFDKLTWRPTEGNKLGVETAVVEGDPSKPGYYLTINHFPAGVMSRPHYHPDERYVIVLRGTWYTDEGDVVYVPRQTWHLASFGGQEGLRSCRLAMNGFPYQAHMFEPD
jgi:hypothetical protein